MVPPCRSDRSCFHQIIPAWASVSVSITKVVLAIALGSAACNSSDAAGIIDDTLYALVNVTVSNTQGQATLTRVQLLWDGAVIDDQSFTPPLDTYYLGGTAGTRSGTHKVGVKVISQTGSPITYMISTSVIAAVVSSGATQSIDLPDTDQSIKTGSTVTLSVTLH